LASLEIFERAINGLDIATGKVKVGKGGYVTTGTAKSTFREGNGTIQFSVLPANATYNTSTNRPNPPVGKRGLGVVDRSGGRERLRRRGRLFKPRR
jgi:hypothetical protein